MTSVKLSLDGELYSRWSEYSVATDLRRSSSTWSLKGRWSGGTTPRLEAGGIATLWVGDERVLWGRVGDVVTQSSRGQSRVEIAGRDGGGLLTDCAARLDWRWRQAQLRTIAEEIRNYVGLPGATVLDEDQVVQAARVELGESCWSLLERVAKAAGARLWIEPAGALHVGEYPTSGESVGTLRRSSPAASHDNVVESRVVRSVESSWSEVTVVGDHRGDSGHAHFNQTWYDLTAPTFKPGVLVEDVKSNAEALAVATREGRRARARRFELRYTVHGHEVAPGVPWAPAQLVHLADEVEDIDEQLLVVARTFSYSRRMGTRTELVLLRPGDFGA